MSTVRRLLALLAPHRRALLIATLLMVATTAATLAGPALIGMAIDQGIRTGDVERLEVLVLAFVAAAAIEHGAGAGQRYTLIRVGVRVITDLRARLFAHLLRLPHGFHDRNRPGDLMSRVSADTETLSDFITWSVISSLQSLLTLLGIVWFLLRSDIVLAGAAFSVVPLMTAATWRWTKATRIRYARVRTAVGDVSATAEEALSGIRVVKGLGQERAAQRRFARVNDEQRSQDLGTDRTSAAFYPIIDVLGDVAVAVVLGLGGLRVLQGALQPGDLVAIILLVQRFFEPVRDLTTRLDSLQDAVAAGGRIFEVLDTRSGITDPPSGAMLGATRSGQSRPVHGHVRLEHVDFAYLPDVPVLHDVQLDIPAGATVALVGETGAGKTSIARLVGRFYDVSGGRVTIDGIDVRDVTVASLRRHIAWVPQEVGLFGGTVLDNLRYGRPEAGLEEVRAAADAVGADEVFSALPQGYDTRLEEGGGGLSAGQRQLVAFTRALLTDPAVVILDEATASVDLETEARMQAGLRRLLAGRTAVVIAHRLSTIVGADLIVVVEAGRIVERGTSAELLVAGGRYAALHRAQLDAEGVVVPG